MIHKFKKYAVYVGIFVLVIVTLLVTMTDSGMDPFAQVIADSIGIGLIIWGR